VTAVGANLDPFKASQPGVFRRNDRGDVIAMAPPRTDLYIDPARDISDATAPVLSAPTMLGSPPAGDFQLSARVTVDFAATYDAGVLLGWADDRNWAKLCFEYAPAGEPMVVSVVTRGVSDDANAFTLGERSVRLRISRIDRVYAFHASTDATVWQLIRVFTLDDDVELHRVGFEAQSPIGEGCAVTFDEIRFTDDRLTDPRDGS